MDEDQTKGRRAATGPAGRDQELSCPFQEHQILGTTRKLSKTHSFQFLWSLHSTGMAGQLKSPANISFSLQGGWSVVTSTTALCSCHNVLLCCFVQPALILKLPKGCLPNQHSKHYNPGLTTRYRIRNQGAHLWEDFLSLSIFLNCLQFFVYGWGSMGINIFVIH